MPSISASLLTRTISIIFIILSGISVSTNSIDNYNYALFLSFLLSIIIAIMTQIIFTNMEG
jgi:hypothetical protein